MEKSEASRGYYKETHIRIRILMTDLPFRDPAADFYRTSQIFEIPY